MAATRSNSLPEIRSALTNSIDLDQGWSVGIQWLMLTRGNNPRRVTPDQEGKRKPHASFPGRQTVSRGVSEATTTAARS